MWSDNDWNKLRFVFLGTRKSKGSLRMFYLNLVLCFLLISLPAAAENWAILIGVDEYEKRGITPLNYAVTDVQGVARVLKSTGYPEQNVFLLTNRGEDRDLATGTNIIWRLEWLAERLRPEDTILFYFSGHGMERDGDTYLLSYDADIGSETTLKRTAVRMAELQEIAKRMKASTILTFMDACRNDPEAGKSVADNKMTEGLSRDLQLTTPQPRGGLVTNATFFSCSPGERSWESEKHGYGFFSYYVMRGLLGEAAGEDGVVTINSLETYLSSQVPDAVDRNTGKVQSPWVDRKGTAGGDVFIASASTLDKADFFFVTETAPPLPESTNNELTYENSNFGIRFELPTSQFQQSGEYGDSQSGDGWLISWQDDRYIEIQIVRGVNSREMYSYRDELYGKLVRYDGASNVTAFIQQTEKGDYPCISFTQRNPSFHKRVMDLFVPGIHYRFEVSGNPAWKNEIEGVFSQVSKTLEPLR